jgi:hypothetical protein
MNIDTRHLYVFIIAAILLVIVAIALTTAVSPTVTLVNPGSDADSTRTESPSGLEIIDSDLTVLRGCSDNQILKWDETEDDWNCEEDGAPSPYQITWSQTGDVDVTLDVEDLRQYFSTTLTAVAARCSVDTAPTTSAVIVQFIKNGSTDMFADVDRPSIAAAGFTNESTTFSSAGIVSGDYVTIDIEASDSGNTAQDLVCQLRFN